MSLVRPLHNATDTTAKPWTRWWWMGSAVTKPELTRHLEAYAAAGIGGVEIIPIYGVQGWEADFIDYLSPQWIEMLAHTLHEARRLGLGVDMTLGTGWPWGGKHVALEHAPRRLVFHKQTFTGNALLHLSREQMVVEAAAWSGADGRLRSIPVVMDSTELVWTAPAEEGTLYVAFAGPTGQKVKRAAPGGAGDVMSPYSTEALCAFLAPFERLFEDQNAIPRCIFYDSFEAFGADFTPGILDRFELQKGYDLREHLDALMGEGDAERVGRVRCDYRDVLFSCLLEEFAEPWSVWTRERGMNSRYQAHGSPGNLLDLYASADIPETEVFGSNCFPFLPMEPHRLEVPEQYPLVNKMASSAAHLADSRLVSSETFTWHREHFRGSLAEMKAELDQLFLTGINHVFFHGSTYSPENAPWPGWVFYASTHFDMAQPFWRDLPAFNRYIASCQRILQDNPIVNDILLYFPFHDVISIPGEQVFQQLSVHNLDQWITALPWGDVAMQLWEHSFGFDMISDRLLRTLEVRSGRLFAAEAQYQAVVLPPCSTLPLATVECLWERAAAGVLVVFMEQIPTSQPGYAGLNDGGAFAQAMESLLPHCHLAADYAALVEILRDAGIRPNPITPVPGLHAIKLRGKDGIGLFLCNLSDRAIEQWVEFPIQGEHWMLHDPLLQQTGLAASRQETTGTAIYLQLQPGESRFIFPSESAEEEPWPYVGQSAEPIPLTGPWELEFIEGGPVLPGGRTLDKLESWTLLDAPAAREFSGTARYTLTFDFDRSEHRADRWHLRLPEVQDSVRISLNGVDVATLWSRPTEIDVTRFLQPGKNVLVCEVTNLAANRIAAMDRRQIPWQIFYDINIVTLNYLAFNAADWEPMPSGLTGSVELTPMTILQIEELCEKAGV